MEDDRTSKTGPRCRSIQGRNEGRVAVVSAEDRQKCRRPPLICVAVFGKGGGLRGGVRPLSFSIRTKSLHGAYTAQKNKKPSLAIWAKCLISLGWLMGLEPTTTGITILDSTN